MVSHGQQMSGGGQCLHSTSDGRAAGGEKHIAAGERAVGAVGARRNRVALFSRRTNSASRTSSLNEATASCLQSAHHQESISLADQRLHATTSAVHDQVELFWRKSQGRIKVCGGHGQDHY